MFRQQQQARNLLVVLKKDNLLSISGNGTYNAWEKESRHIKMQTWTDGFVTGVLMAITML